MKAIVIAEWIRISIYFLFSIFLTFSSIYSTLSHLGTHFKLLLYARTHIETPEQLARCSLVQISRNPILIAKPARLAAERYSLGYYPFYREILSRRVSPTLTGPLQARGRGFTISIQYLISFDLRYVEWILIRDSCFANLTLFNLCPAFFQWFLISLFLHLSPTFYFIKYYNSLSIHISKIPIQQPMCYSLELWLCL